MRRYYFIFLAILILGVVIVFVLFNQKFSRPKYVWESNAGQMYKFSFNSNIKTLLLDNDVSQDYTYSGILNFKIFNIEEDFVNVGLQLSEFEIKSNGIEFLTNPDSYQKLFFVTFKKSGEIIKYYFPPNIPLLPQKSLKEFVNILQFVVSQKDKPVWETSETGEAGEYLSRYEIKSDSIEKIKTKYKKNEDEKTALHVLFSKFSGKVNENCCWLFSLDGNEEISFEDDRGRQLINAKFSLSLDKIKLEQDKNLDIWNEKRMFSQIISDFSLPQGQNVSTGNNKAQNTVTKNNKIDTYIKEIKEGNKKLRFKHELVDFLKQEPDQIQFIYDFILKNRDETAALTLINVLELVGTPQAQDALIKILTHEKHSDSNRLRAVVALGGIESPTVKAVDALWDSYYSKDALAKNISNTSMLSLGALQPRMDLATKNDTRQRLIEELKTGDFDKQNIAIRAIGNTKDISFINDVTPHLSSQDSRVREAVAFALGNMDDKDSCKSLLKAITDEKESFVRKEIMKSLLKIDFDSSTINVIKEEMYKEKNDGVRILMVRYLVNHVNEFDEIRSVLGKWLPNETNKGITKIIIKGLRKV